MFFNLSSKKKAGVILSLLNCHLLTTVRQSPCHWVDVFIFLHKTEPFCILVGNVRNYLSIKKKILAMVRKWLKKSLKSSLPSKLRYPEGLRCKSSSVWESHRPEFRDITA